MGDAFKGEDRYVMGAEYFDCRVDIIRHREIRDCKISFEDITDSQQRNYGNITLQDIKDHMHLYVVIVCRMINPMLY